MGMAKVQEYERRFLEKVYNPWSLAVIEHTSQGNEKQSSCCAQKIKNPPDLISHPTGIKLEYVFSNSKRCHIIRCQNIAWKTDSALHDANIIGK